MKSILPERVLTLQYMLEGTIPEYTLLLLELMHNNGLSGVKGTGITNVPVRESCEVWSPATSRTLLQTFSTGSD